MPEKVIKFRFRWNCRVPLDDQRLVEVVIPLGGDVMVLNPDFVDASKLNDDEVEKCENLVLREIAIVGES